MFIMFAKRLAILLCCTTLAVAYGIAGSLKIKPLNNIKEQSPLTIFNSATFNTDNGLSSNYVNCICRDDDGIMWFGTNDGLCRYDGHEFNIFLPERDNKEAISGKDIRDIKRVGNHHLRVTSADGGVTIYDKLNNIFRDPEELYGISYSNDEHNYQYTYDILEIGDYSYIAYGDHILKLDNKTGATISIPLPHRDLISGMELTTTHMEKMIGTDDYVIMTFGKEDTGNLYMGVLSTKYNNIRVIRYQRLDDKTQNTLPKFINDVCPIDSANVYVATTEGLFVYNIYQHKMYKQPLKGVTNVHCIALGHNNDYWISHDNSEILKWNPSEGSYSKIENANYFLSPQTKTREMYEDENGLLWVATTNYGVVKLDTKSPKIKTHHIESELPPYYDTHSIHGQDSQNLYAACGHDGLLRINIADHTSELIKVPERNIWSVYQRRNGDVYVGTTQDLRIYKPNAKVPYKIVKFPESITDTVSRIITNDVCEDCLGNVWIATKIGLFRYNGYSCEPLTSQVFWGDKIECVYEDSDGRIWCGNDKGSFVKQPQDTLFVETDAYKTNRAPNNHTFCFCEYKNKVLIGTASGILSYDKNSGHVSTFEFNQDFDNTIIRSIATDGKDVLWVSSSSGIGYIDGNIRRVYHFNHYDGLRHFGVTCPKFTTINGYVYFGNAASVSSINVNRVRLNERLCRTTVSHLLYGQSGEMSEYYMTTDSIYNIKYLLKAGLRISLASSDMSIPTRNEYAYKVEGNDEWINLGTNNEIILSGLMPGEYRVDVRSSNSDKQWSPFIHSFVVNIIPPMWASKPALIFYSVVLLLLIWLLLNLRFRSVSRKMRLMAEEMRGKKAIEEQRNKLAKLHKDQTDSISYAKHIQEGIMPKAESVAHRFKKLFILYNPKDIVSGDFCCFYNRDNITFIIAADCTGHGVPGAFISILGMDHLFNIIMKQKVNDAGKILTALHQETYSTVFKHSSSNHNFNEGIDMTICAVHHDENYLEFAGAMNELYMIRDNEITTYKGDRYTIGTNTSIDPNQEILPIYRTTRVQYKRGDMFYMFSDGYVDQFGGPEQKKFKHRRFKHLLLNIHKMPARDQKVILHQRLEDWKGVNEQTDDISVVGFEPWNQDNNVR